MTFHVTNWSLSFDNLMMIVDENPRVCTPPGCHVATFLRDKKNIPPVCPFIRLAKKAPGLSTGGHVMHLRIGELNGNLYKITRQLGLSLDFHSLTCLTDQADWVLKKRLGSIVSQWSSDKKPGSCHPLTISITHYKDPYKPMRLSWFMSGWISRCERCSAQ